MEPFLIVDDDLRWINMYTTLIRRRYGDVLIIQANNGKEALSKAIISAYSVILTDIDMPIMNGIDFHKALKKRFPLLAKRTAFISSSSHEANLKYIKEENLPCLSQLFELDDFYKMIDAIVATEDIVLSKKLATGCQRKEVREQKMLEPVNKGLPSGCDDILDKSYEKQELPNITTKNITINTREHKRRPFNIEVTCNTLMKTGLNITPEKISGKALNISIGGMLVEIKDPFPLDTYLEFNIFADGHKLGIPARGRVAWSDKQKMGVQFLHIPLQIEILLDDQT